LLFWVRSRKGIVNLAVTGRIKKRRARGRQRLKCLDNLYASWKPNVSTARLIRVLEDEHEGAEFAGPENHESRKKQ